MPLYEYRCTSCDYKFEKIQKFSDAPETVCPKCRGELVQPMTAPALKFEGAGWYINDYSSKGSASASNSETKSAAGESKGSEPGTSSTPASSDSGSGSSGSGSSSSASSASSTSGSTTAAS